MEVRGGDCVCIWLSGINCALTISISFFFFFSLNLEIPDEFIPKCSNCNGPTLPNVRGGNWYVVDDMFGK
jgi:hypothetical protein